MPYDLLTSQRFPDDFVAPFAQRVTIDQGPPGGLMPYEQMAERLASCKALPEHRPRRRCAHGAGAELRSSPTWASGTTTSTSPRPPGAGRVTNTPSWLIRSPTWLRGVGHPASPERSERARAARQLDRECQDTFWGSIRAADARCSERWRGGQAVHAFRVGSSITRGTASRPRSKLRPAPATWGSKT